MAQKTKKEYTIDENIILHSIMDYLLTKKIYAWRNNNAPIYDVRRNTYRKRHRHELNGVSDILGIFNGRLLAIEVKTEVGTVSKEQQEFIQAINRNGGIAFVARSIDDVIKNLYANATRTTKRSGDVT